MKRQASKTINIEPQPKVCKPCNSEDECPSYGSQNYWEDRYKNNYGNDVNHKKEEQEGEAGFSWYFTYEELSPLILPLVLGRDEEEDEDWSSDEEEEVEEEIEEIEEEEIEEDENIAQDAEDIEDDVEGEDDTTQLLPTLKKMDGKAPAKVLEIGCGDVPLGNGLCEQLLTMEQNSNIKLKDVVESIICFDYSKACIDILQKIQSQQTQKKDSLQVDYKVHDARKLPYESRTFQLVMDKGTLDAMLADKVEGRGNCVKIVSEAARTLAMDGYILIVSHLNANNAEGYDWANDILSTGLKSGDSDCNWQIEVHGNDVEEENDNEDDENETEDDDESKNYGPAVYICKKVAKRNKDNECKVGMKFLGY
ncbi:hypothetical protein CTEN210_06514 [Chaetoceros tenuissimus]|uniref:Methyltransferase type 11 domain-containing protein n=1 Tax=Chaetoceros tenuissimus TaxID=426638 RepID=A0AAD3CQI4_9STRA|nr:hypothetical protein CTEN210_06514 [Chaetoceros tenuissimus]